MEWEEEGVKWEDEGVEWEDEGVEWEDEGVEWEDEGVECTEDPIYAQFINTHIIMYISNSGRALKPPFPTTTVFALKIRHSNFRQEKKICSSVL